MRNALRGTKKDPHAEPVEARTTVVPPWAGAMTAVPDDLLAFAGRLADASGAIAKRYFRSGVGIETKPDKSPVTLADRAAEAAIRELIGDRYPDHGVVGEEHGADRPD